MEIASEKVFIFTYLYIPIYFLYAYSYDKVQYKPDLVYIYI